MRREADRKGRSGRRGRTIWLAAGMMSMTTAIGAAFIPNLMPFVDPTGIVSTYNTAGAIDTRNPFFKSLGTNGRSCATCHAAGDAFGLRASTIQARFASTQGRDPLFAAVDGANCPDAATGDPASHSALLNNGLFRVALTVPEGAQFTIRTVRDPFGCALVTDPVTGRQTVSVYRRPLPSSNLRFLSAVMFDGRETVQPLTDAATFDQNLVTDLMHQSVDATLGHAQAATAPTIEQQKAIVAFELGLSSAQSLDSSAGLLSTFGALGGPMPLSSQPFHPGINDTLGQDPAGAPFNPEAFSLFGRFGGRSRVPGAVARTAIAAGERIFNTHPLTITHVPGLNDNPAVAAALGATLPIPAIPGTCTTCHNTPNVGNHSSPLPLDLGISHDAINESNAQVAGAISHLTEPDVPVYEIDGCPNPFPDPSRPDAPFAIDTSDPGRALITGRCADVNRVKGPILRGLAARAPYFHNGSAGDIHQVVSFYDERFGMNLTDEEKSQLAAFLNSL
jgi:cytochrome c peroxidase